MCDSCVPTASAPLRLSTNGRTLRTRLLIDSDEHATVISVEVDVDRLIVALRESKHAARAEYEEQCRRDDEYRAALLSTNHPAVGYPTVANPGKE